MSDEQDRLWRVFRRLVERATHRVKYYGRFAARIAEQAANLEVGVLFDSDELAGQNPLPIRPGLPGFTCKVPAGTRCAVGFDDGDPRRPVVVGFEAGSPVTEVVFAGGTKGCARVDDNVDLGWWILTAPSGGGPVTAVQVAPGTPTAVHLDGGKITTGSGKLKVG